VDTWLTAKDMDTLEGNSSDPTSSMLAELDDILQTFPYIQPDDVLQHLPALNPLSFLALDNANDTLTHSQMLCAPDKQNFLDAEEQELNECLEVSMDIYPPRKCKTNQQHMVLPP